MKKAAWFAAMVLFPCLAAATPEKTRGVPKQPVGSLEELFGRADVNKDGNISMEEAEKVSAPLLANNFAAIDTSKDGKLSMDEVRAFIQKQREQGIAQIVNENKDNFARIDADKNGSISIEEAEKASAPLMANNFAAIDANKDGKLSAEEIGAFILAQREQAVSRMRKENEDVFHGLDTNNDGSISLEEAKKAKASLVVDSFAVIDSNKDGKLSPQEMAAFLRMRREQIARFQAADMDHNRSLSKSEAETFPELKKDFDKIDANHDGQISLEEINTYSSKAQASVSAPKENAKK
ncbi:MAG: EF-hand domain-containing protein [Nitrosomonadales bacterium]|nr:EF-hand domain-containing protein [Nitrosomonadales bacterium]